MRQISQRQCMHCGKLESLWQDNGYELNDNGYCCRGCAEDYVCTCQDAGSGRLVMLDFNHY